MTCIGYAIACGRAIAWADSETYIDHEPYDHRLKIEANALARIIGLASGGSRLCAFARQVIVEADCFDDAVERLPYRMQRGTMRQVAEGVSPLAEATTATFALVGWSDRFGTVAGAVFREENEYRPIFPRTFASPWREGFDVPDDDHGIISVAQQQMAVMRQGCADNGAGTLIAATLTRHSIELRRIFDFGTCTMYGPGAADSGSFQPATPGQVGE